MQRYRNASGNYNGIRLMADLTGLDSMEIEWLANRIQQLMASGSSATDAKNTAKEEGKAKPWTKRDEWR